MVGLAILLALLNFLLRVPWTAWGTGVGTGLTMLAWARLVILPALLKLLLGSVWVGWVVGLAGVGQASWAGIGLAITAAQLKLRPG